MFFLETLGTILIVALLPLVIYTISKCGKDFNLISWLIQSETRMILGFILILLLSLVITFVPEAKDILAAVGFNTDKPAALGLAIGGLLVAGIRGNQN